MRQTSIIVFLLFLLFMGWELMGCQSVRWHFLLPPPSEIVGALLERGLLFAHHTSVTLRIMLLGMGLAVLAAFPLGLLMSLSRSMSTVLQPLFVVVQCMPMFALAPIMVLWFGWSLTAAVLPTALMVVFPLTLNIYKGLTGAPSDLVDYFRANGATGWQELWKLRLPFAQPQIFAGLRIAAAVAGIGAIAGEWAGAQDGLGVLILQGRREADVTLAFAALVCVMLVSFSLYALVIVLERLVGRRDLRCTVACSLAVLACIGSSCSSSAEKELRLLLDWTPNPTHVPLFVGVEKGFFEEEGVGISLQRAQDPGDGLLLLATEQVDLALGYMPQTLRAVSRGAPLCWVGTLIDQPLNCLIYRTESGIRTLQDLNGKVLGTTVSETHSTTLATLLEEADVRVKRCIRIGYDLVPAIAAGQIEAVYGAYHTIEVPQLRSLGVSVDAIPISALGVPDYHEVILLANREAVLVDADQLNRLRRALQRSIDWARLHPDEAFEIYAASNPVKGCKILTWEREAWGATIDCLATSQLPERELWERFLSWQRSIGLVSHDVDVEVLLGI